MTRFRWKGISPRILVNENWGVDQFSCFPVRSLVRWLQLLIPTIRLTMMHGMGCLFSSVRHSAPQLTAVLLSLLLFLLITASGWLMILMMTQSLDGIQLLASRYDFHVSVVVVVRLLIC